MSLRTSAATAATRAMGSGAATRVAAARNRGGLRILAMHEVVDAQAFERLVIELVRRWTPVSGREVLAARAGETTLPDRAVWITFDDGHPSVVADALPVLTRLGVPASMYVCPGLIESGSAPWWELVLAAGEAGEGAEVEGVALVGSQLVRALKGVSDAERRRVVAELAPHAGDATLSGALTEAELHTWVEAGMEVGNHTWDHPCLDRCSGEEQVAQLTRAHEWLVRRWGDAIRTAAYPNGDHTETSEAALAYLGYDLALMFDHRMATFGQPALRTSRLRLDADAPESRVRAVVAGGHSEVFHGAQRLAGAARRLRSTGSSR